jgi:N-acyl-D-amino-acid deacylase
MTALDEAIEIALESGVRMQVSHLKALGRDNRGKGSEALRRLAAAVEKGAHIAADQYPYAASATSLTAVVPQWAHAGGVAALLGRLADPLLTERLVSEVSILIAQREGAAGIMISSCRSEKNRRFAGKTLEFVATEWGCTAGEAVIRLLSEERGEVPAVFFSMGEEDVRTILADPTVAVGSDGHGLNREDAADDATHPRSYGCFPRVLGRYVREHGVLDLHTAIRKMTQLPAARLGMTDRGTIGVGQVADIVLFDPSTIADRADYVNPHQYSSGIVHLLIGGTPVISDGSLTGIRDGRVLRNIRHERHKP